MRLDLRLPEALAEEYARFPQILPRELSISARFLRGEGLIAFARKGAQGKKTVAPPCVHEMALANSCRASSNLWSDLATIPRLLSTNGSSEPSASIRS